MKKNEIALLILIVSIVALLSYFALNALLSGVSDKKITVEKTTELSKTIVAPDPTVFSADAINPTIKVKIGDLSGQQPFTINQ